MMAKSVRFKINDFISDEQRKTVGGMDEIHGVYNYQEQPSGDIYIDLVATEKSNALAVKSYLEGEGYTIDDIGSWIDDGIPAGLVEDDDLFIEGTPDFWLLSEYPLEFHNFYGWIIRRIGKLGNYVNVAQYETTQDAHDAATEGDTLLFPPGVYSPVIVDKIINGFGIGNHRAAIIRSTDGTVPLQFTANANQDMTWANMTVEATTVAADSCVDIIDADAGFVFRDMLFRGNDITTDGIVIHNGSRIEIIGCYSNTFTGHNFKIADSGFKQLFITGGKHAVDGGLVFLDKITNTYIKDIVVQWDATGGDMIEISHGGAIAPYILIDGLFVRNNDMTNLIHTTPNLTAAPIFNLNGMKFEANPTNLYKDDITPARDIAYSAANHAYGVVLYNCVLTEI